MTRNELFEAMRAVRVELLTILMEVPEELIDIPHSIGDWSLKDLVAHLVAWEEEALKRIDLINAGREKEIVYFNSEDVDDWNARAVEARRCISWPEMLVNLMSVRGRLWAALEGMSDHLLFAETGPVAVQKWLPDFTFLHQREHCEGISAWLKEAA